MGTPLSVLLVDDESLIRWSVGQTLVDQGHSVVEAVDAQSAVRAVRRAARPFDVALIDLRLPDSDDLSLLATIRAAAPTTRVIMMTAFGSPDVTRGALDLGAYRVIGKPFDLLALTPLVADAAAAP